MIRIYCLFTQLIRHQAQMVYTIWSKRRYSIFTTTIIIQVISFVIYDQQIAIDLE